PDWRGPKSVSMSRVSTTKAGGLGWIGWQVVTDQGEFRTGVAEAISAAVFHFYYSHRPDGKAGRWGIPWNGKKVHDYCRV
ncbi:MAG: hypothetical protein ACK54R_01455, partial [Pirellulaceae bacterium]